jgi:hypothetical protein
VENVQIGLVNVQDAANENQVSVTSSSSGSGSA